MTALAGVTASKKTELALPPGVYDRSVSATSWPETASDVKRKAVSYTPHERHSIGSIVLSSPGGEETGGLYCSKQTATFYRRSIR